MRILHAPVDVAGIGASLSAYQCSLGYVSEFLVFNENPFFKDYDHCLHLSSVPDRYKNLILWRNFAWCLCKYDIFHFYFGRTLLPRGLDLRLLRLCRKKIVMTCCGTDYRLMEVERQRNPYISRYLDEGIIKNSSEHDQQIKNLLRYQSRWVQCFFAPRNVYAHVATVVDQKRINHTLWIHNVACDSEGCISPESVSTGTVPLIVHVPSNKRVKGTQYVQQAISSLQSKGVPFRYREISGVTHGEALNLLRNADIVIDQMLLGGIGTTVFEAMSFGKPVVSYVIEDVMEKLYPDCPVFNANIDNLEQRLEILIKDMALRVELGRRGVEFVRKYLDKHLINRELLKIYEGLPA